MTILEFADGLNGRDYGNEITPFEEQRAKELGYVIVFGYSDDCAEFRGAIYDEIDCFDGGRVFEENGKYIDAVWCEGGYTWSYNTNIPHETFDLYEDGEKWCKGIIFKKSDTEMQCLTETGRVDDLGRIRIPKEMRKNLGINEGDTLQLTATGNIIVIEKCEGEEE